MKAISFVLLVSLVLLTEAKRSYENVKTLGNYKLSCPDPRGIHIICTKEYPPKNQCDNNGDCKRGQFCCPTNSCGRRCWAPQKNSICCPNPKNYYTVCSPTEYKDKCRTDSDCPLDPNGPGSWCCPINGCGKECVTYKRRNFIKRNLICPDPRSSTKICIHYRDQCKSDDSCPDGKRCCLISNCGRECVDPIYNNPRCPRPPFLTIKCGRYENLCQADKDCKKGTKCCLITNCGKRCWAV